MANRNRAATAANKRSAVGIQFKENASRLRAGTVTQGLNPANSETPYAAGKQSQQMSSLDADGAIVLTLAEQQAREMGSDLSDMLDPLRPILAYEFHKSFIGPLQPEQHATANRFIQSFEKTDEAPRFNTIGM